MRNVRSAVGTTLAIAFVISGCGGGTSSSTDASAGIQGTDSGSADSGLAATNLDSVAALDVAPADTQTADAPVTPDVQLQTDVLPGSDAPLADAPPGEVAVPIDTNTPPDATGSEDAGLDSPNSPLLDAAADACSGGADGQLQGAGGSGGGGAGGAGGGGIGGMVAGGMVMLAGGMVMVAGGTVTGGASSGGTSGTGGTGGMATGGAPTSQTLFITSTPVSPNLGGLTGADDECQEFAVSAGLSGTWKAVLGDSTTTAQNHVSVTGSVHTTTGALIAANPTAFWSGSAAAAPATESGGSPAATVAWVGSSTDNCSNWSTTDSSATGAQASSTNLTAWLQVAIIGPCNFTRSLYCINGGGAVCTAGYHDGGGGTCVANGTNCASGYHNDGTANCVANKTCPVDQLSDGTGTCVPMAGVTWTPHAASQRWLSVASSADGTKLVAGVFLYGGHIYTSTDFGVIWTQQSISQDWLISVASSADGMKLVAAAFGGYLYTSTDSGVTWTQGGTSQNWQSVASSADGTKFVAAVFDGYVYTSTDSGLTWTSHGTSQSWYGVASSADGTKLVAVGSSYIYTSTDSGLTWTQRGTYQLWRGVASSADGTKLVAADNGRYIYTSTDSGVTWTPHGTSLGWTSVASSADGTKLVAAANNPSYIYTSTDSGLTWTQRGTSQTWTSVASSADGTKLVAVADGGYIYTSSGPVPNPCPSGQSPCNDACVSAETDNNNCGGCGNICTGGQTCQGGACCPSGQYGCFGACLNVETDNNNCGGCGTKCTSGQTCQSGTCTCPSGQSPCNGACVDVLTDVNNCGSCGNICSEINGYECISGSCICDTCP